MSKTCYEEYVNHAMRFYVRNPALHMSSPGLKKSDVQNWVTCNDVINGYSKQDRETITDVYLFKGGLPDAVFTIAARNHTETCRIWQLLNRFAKDFAKKRGLI